MQDADEAALSNCRSIDDVSRFFVDAIRPLGFTVSACGAFLPSERGPLTHFFFQNWPSDWIALYQRKNFVVVDFSVAEARRRMAPFTWLDARAERTLSLAEKELWKAANANGWENGLSVPLHGPGGYFGLVSIGGKNLDLSPATRRRLHLLAFAVHERCRAIHGVSPVADQQARLTARELECLRWVAAGKTDGDIAQIIDLSPTTVKDHIDAGRRKLDAQTRAQAVARLVLGGLA